MPPLGDGGKNNNMATTTRTKKKVIENVSLEDAQAASQAFAQNSNNLRKIEAKMNEEITKVRSKYQEDITALTEANAQPIEILEVFATEQKQEWGKKKSFELLHAIIGFRTGTPKVTKAKKFSWDAVLELMKKNNVFKGFIRTTEEINKEAILSEQNEAVLNQLKEECYIDVVQEESFYVTAKAEEVTA